MSEVPSNLIPTRITQLPVAPTASEDSLMMIVYQGNNYQIRVGDLLSVAGVPTSTQVIAGTSLTGGGQLTGNVTLSVAPGGIGTAQLANTGVTPGVYGGASSIPVFTVDETGRVLSASNIAVSVTGYVPVSRQVIAGTGLTGGGALNANVTLNADFSDATPGDVVNLGSAGVATTMSRSDHQHPAIDLSDDTQVDNLLGLDNGGTARSLVMAPGAVIWSGADGLYVGPPGVLGQVLISGGTGAPTWGSALVISDQAANTVYAGPVSGPNAPTTFRALVNADLPVSGVTANTYGSTTTVPVITVDSKGVVTAASTVPFTSGGVTSVDVSGGTTGLSFSGGPVTSSGTITMAGTLDLDNGGTGSTTASGARTALGLGTIAVQDANNVAITGGTVALSASTSSLVPLHINPGTRPSSVSDGDIWVETKGLFAKNNSYTHQLDFDTNTSGTLSKVAITITGGGATFSAATIDAFLFSLSNWNGDFKKYTIPAATGLVLADNTTTYLTVNYNSGSPVFAVTTDVTTINGSNIAGAAILYRMGSEVHFQPVDWGLAPASRTNRRFIQTNRYERASGLALGESTGNVITLSAGVIWYGVAEYAELAVTSAASNADFYYHVAGVYTKSTVSTYNNLQYDDGTGLQTLSGGRYAVNWVYRYLDGAGLPKLAYILGSVNSTLAQAVASATPVAPSILTQMAILVGRIIVLKSAATATQIDSAFTQVFSSSTVTNHNDLANLQGGTANEYFHLTSAEYTGSGTGTFVRAVNPTIGTKLTVTGLVESTVSGYKFPDGTTQTTAASGSAVTVSATAPVSPSQGQEWEDTNTSILYTWIDDGDSSQWVELGPVSAGGSGTVSSITAGTGLSGGTITTSGTIALANTAVTAGSYTATNITVDAQGRITAAANGTGGGITSNRAFGIANIFRG